MINRTYITQTGDIKGHQLICDTFPLKLMRNEVVTESVNGVKQKVLKLGGRFQMADELNANQRIYPQTVLEQAVEQIQDDIKARGVLGEYEHPVDAKIHLERVSHLISKLWMEGREVFGECEVLERLPFGKQLRGLIESNVRIGISSRGVGDMESSLHEGEECYKVLPGYAFVTFDCVADASVPGATLTVKESRDRLNKAINFKENREKNILKVIREILRKSKK